MRRILLSKEKIHEINNELKILRTSLQQKRDAEAKRGGLLDSWHETAANAATQGAIEQKVSEFQEILKKASILPRKVNSKSVVLGSFVYLKNKDIQTYRLVHPIEADPRKGFISIESPLGKLLLGKRLNDKISYLKNVYTINKLS